MKTKRMTAAQAVEKNLRELLGDEMPEGGLQFVPFDAFEASLKEKTCALDQNERDEVLDREWRALTAEEQILLGFTAGLGAHSRRGPSYGTCVTPAGKTLFVLACSCGCGHVNLYELRHTTRDRLNDIVLAWLPRLQLDGR
jgi:hypothetical protein